VVVVDDLEDNELSEYKDELLTDFLGLADTLGLALSVADTLAEGLDVAQEVGEADFLGDPDPVLLDE
jgi:hypothetical protein